MAVLSLPSPPLAAPLAAEAAGRPQRRPRRAAGAVVLAGVLLVHLWAADLWRLPPRPLPGQRTAMQVMRMETVVRPPAVPAVQASPVPVEQLLPSTPAAIEAVAPASRRPEAVAAASTPSAPVASAPDAGPASGPAQVPLAEPAVPAADAVDAASAAADEGEADAMSLPSNAAPPPLYATQLPAPAQLLYSLQRGALRGEARLQWQRDGQRYALQFDAVATSRRGPPLIEQRSSGQLDANGLAPDRYTDRRRGRGTQAANFQRDAGRISFSGPRVEYPAWAGAQDRLGTLVQLAGIYSAASQPPAEVTLFVVGARGGAGLWTFKLQGTETVSTALGDIRTLYLRRDPERREDLRVEVWLDPARSHWPVRIRSTPMRGGDPLELTLAAEPAKP